LKGTRAKKLTVGKDCCWPIVSPQDVRFHAFKSDTASGRADQWAARLWPSL